MIECEECGEEFDEDEEFALLDDGEQLCSFCNSDAED